VENLKAAAADIAAEEHSSLMKIALWLLSCIQWCSPVLTKQAVNAAVRATVNIVAAAAAAVSVLGADMQCS
jgi:hypothetical protein